MVPTSPAWRILTAQPPVREAGMPAVWHCPGSQAIFNAKLRHVPENRSKLPCMFTSRLAIVVSQHLWKKNTSTNRNLGKVTMYSCINIWECWYHVHWQASRSGWKMYFLPGADPPTPQLSWRFPPWQAGRSTLPPDSHPKLWPSSPRRPWPEAMAA